MKVMRFFFFIVLLLYTPIISAKVAIIGKGLGAALCSYYLHKMIPKLAIDIYNHKSPYKALSRNIVHSSNVYMSKLIEEKEFDIYADVHRPMVKEGDQTEFFNVKELAETDPIGYSKLQEFVKQKINKFDQIYGFQKNRKCFKTVRELLHKLDPDFVKYYTEETIFSLLHKILAPEASPAIIKFVKTGIIGTCLADINTQALAALDTLMFSEITGKIVQITSEEEDVIKKLFHKKDNFINMDISKIVHSKEDNINYVVPNDNRPIEYDYVILASVTAVKIKFEGFKEPVKVFDYQIGKTTYINGDLLETLIDKSNLIINTEKNHTFAKNYEKRVYAITKTSMDASESEILEYVNPYIIHSYGTFKGCPDFSKDKNVRNAKFELGEKLYNVQALDSVSMTTNEMLAISAKNIALLIREKIPKNISTQKTDVENISHELQTVLNLTKKKPKTRRNKKKKPAKKC